MARKRFNPRTPRRGQAHTGRPFASYTPELTPVHSEAKKDFYHAKINKILPQETAPELKEIRNIYGIQGFKKFLESHGIHRSDRTLRLWAQKGEIPKLKEKTPKQTEQIRNQLIRSVQIEKLGGFNTVSLQTGITRRRLHNWVSGKTKKTAPEIQRILHKDAINTWWKTEAIRDAKIKIHSTFTIYGGDNSYTVTRQHETISRTIPASVGRQLAAALATHDGDQGIRILQDHILTHYLEHPANTDHVEIKKIHDLSITWT